MKFKDICLWLMVLGSPLIGQTPADLGILKMPKVTLPAEAKESGLGGRVTVQVEVDEAGNVTVVKEASGPDWVCPSVSRPDVLALREVAKAAASKVKFSPGSVQPGGSLLQVFFDFPTSKAGNKRGKDEYYTAAPADYSGSVKTEGTGEKNTVKGELVGPVNRLPPDDKGAANTASTDKFTMKADESSPLMTVIPGGKSLTGGVLNGKALSLPRPPYPPAARAVRASGSVSIQVLIDEDGRVFSAMPVSGHPLLRPAARLAACGAEFSPTKLMGNPVKVSGIITYNFVP